MASKGYTVGELLDIVEDYEALLKDLPAIAEQVQACQLDGDGDWCQAHRCDSRRCPQRVLQGHLDRNEHRRLTRRVKEKISQWRRAGVDLFAPDSLGSLCGQFGLGRGEATVREVLIQMANAGDLERHFVVYCRRCPAVRRYGMRGESDESVAAVLQLAVRSSCPECWASPPDDARGISGEFFYGIPPERVPHVAGKDEPDGKSGTISGHEETAAPHPDVEGSDAAASGGG